MSAFAISAAAPAVAPAKARVSRTGIKARRAASVRRSVRAAATAEASADTAASASGTKKFYFCIANADFMLNDENNEHFPEVLRERRRFYRETSKEQDFWVVPNPSFLDAMPDVAKKVRQPCVAVVTTDKVWNDFIKLRLDRVYKGAIEGNAEECLASKSLIAADAFAAPDPAKWTAPYNKYAPGWWEAFYPGNENA